MIQVLIVDDDPAILDISKIFLERTKDIKVDTTRSAKEAMDKLETMPYDIILSDYTLPDMDGIEFLKRVRAKYLDIPFIMFSGKGQQEIAVKAIENGANYYLQKEGNTKLLFAELLHHVHQSVSCWRAKKALHNRKEALKKNEELDNFVYSISHDLKAPLRGLSGYAAIMLEDYQDSLDENGKRYLARIGDLSDKMSEMLTGLLEYYRAGRIIEPLEIVDLNEVAGGVLGRYRPKINAKKIKIIVETLPKALCERQKIAQLFSNLIDNAIKFSGDDEPFIKIGCNDCGLEYVIFIEDNGIGFDTDRTDEAFKMFGHLDLDGNAKGTGIGLSIAKKIVEMHGGRMWVESEPGAGSVFYFSLPKVAED